MRTKLMLSVLLLIFSISQAWADERTALQLSKFHSRGQLFCASAMLYFNPQERTPDPRLLSSMYNHLWAMQADVWQLGQPADLVKPVEGIQQLLDQLAGKTSEQKKDYPDLVRQLIVRVLQLQRAADVAYAQEQSSFPADSTAVMFTDQSRALASLLFDYELRHYAMVDKEQFLMSPEQLQKLDQGIENRFSQLLRLHTEHSATLGAIYRNYQFVRGQLQQSKSRANGGAEFYVSRVVIDLDELALTTAVSAP
ncbi:MAG: hypothetical protein VCA57_17505 [Pseudomonas sp.]|uniref:hypothetical protein n=1 Tax=Pseudomonas sp. TaxID=306 RepID=UPI003982CCAA